MANQILRLLYNTRERALSTDLNDSTNLHHRALVEMVMSSLGRQGGVIHGMKATVLGAGLDVTIGAGIALINDGGATADDSDFTWIELTAAQTVTLPAADGANPRWDVIEISDSDGIVLSTPRDIFDPSTGTFTPASVTKRRGSSPTLSVRSGTAAARPEFPAGIASRVPLAYVYVPAAAANLTVGDEVLCRPLLVPVVDNDQGLAPSTDGSQFRELRGGGIRKDAISTAGGANDLNFETKRCTGFFPAERVPFEVPDGGRVTLAYGESVDGLAAAPGANDMLYMYAFSANSAYPSGYDTSLAPREFVPGSNIDTGDRFGVDVVGFGQTGCMIVGSQQSPSNQRSPQGAPAAAAPSNLSYVGFGTVTVDRSEWVYLGAIHYRDDIYNGISTVSTDELSGQESAGALVIPQFPTGDEVTGTGDLTLWTAVVTGSGLGSPGGSLQNEAEFPATALEVKARVLIELDNTATSNVDVQLSDESPSSPAYRWDLRASTAGAERFCFTPSFHVDPADGHINIAALATVDATDELRIACHAYVDSVLAARGM